MLETPKEVLKNNEKIIQGRFLELQKNEHPFFRAFLQQPWTDHCGVIFDDPCQRKRTLAVSEAARRPPKDRDNTKNGVSESDFQLKIIRF